MLAREVYVFLCPFYKIFPLDIVLISRHIQISHGVNAGVNKNKCCWQAIIFKSNTNSSLDAVMDHIYDWIPIKVNHALQAF